MQQVTSTTRTSLRFEDEAVEREFQEKLRPRVRRQVSVSLALSIPIWLLFGLVLFFRAPVLIASSAVGMVVFLVVLLAILRRVRTLHGVQIVGALSNAFPGLLALHVLRSIGLFDVLGPLCVAIGCVFGFTLLNLRFVYALFAVASYVALGIGMIFTSPTFPVPAVQTITLLVLIGVLAVACYLLEAATRRDFLLRRVIAEKDRVIEQERARQLGQYTLGERLGAGGMGEVYRASHAMLRRPTAIKLLPPDMLDAMSVERFEQEVQLTSQLTHPNTITIFDYGRTPDNVFYYAMELLDGVTLQELVDTCGAQPFARVRSVLEQMAAALAEAHEAGLVHRDIKPANVMLCRYAGSVDHVKLLDFGLVWKREENDGVARAARGGVAGTPSYMSPESIADPHRLDHRSDLYAFGAVGYFMLTGRPVFSGAAAPEILAHQVHSTPEPPSKRRREAVPEGLESIVLQCLEKDPSRRPASARELGRRLRGLRGGVGDWTQESAARWWSTTGAVLDRADDARPAVDRTIDVDMTQRDQATVLLSPPREPG